MVIQRVAATARSLWTTCTRALVIVWSSARRELLALGVLELVAGALGVAQLLLGRRLLTQLGEATKAVPESIPRSKGHYQEWVDAIRGGAPAYSNFDIAAYLTEIILLGCVALNVGVGEKLDWDGPNMRARNNKRAADFVKGHYRAGWKLS